MIYLKEIKDKSGLKKFINLAWVIYRNDKDWVPPIKGDLLKTLLGKDNPLFMSGEHSFFIAYKERKAVGRILVGVNESLNEQKNSEDGYFSLFESVEDKEVAFALLDRASEWLRTRGKKVLKGPVSPTNGDDYRGLLVEGFNGPPMLMNSYNHEYYVNFFEEYGLIKHLDLFAYYFDVDCAKMDRYKKVSDYAMERYKFQIDNINLKNIDNEMKDIKSVLDIAMPEEWEDLAPPTIEEIRAEGAKLKPLADENLILIARSEGKPIAFAIALPNYNEVLQKMNGNLFPFGFLKFLYYKKRIKGFRLFVLFVIPEFRKKGVSGTMFYRFFVNGVKQGYTYAEGSTIGETNKEMRVDIEKTGGIKYRTYRLFKKEI